MQGLIKLPENDGISWVIALVVTTDDCHKQPEARMAMHLHARIETHGLRPGPSEQTASLQSGLLPAHQQYVDGVASSTDYVSIPKHASETSVIPHPSKLMEEGSLTAIKRMVEEFLRKLPYRPPGTLQNSEIREALNAEIVSWDMGLSSSHINVITDTGCTIAECAYSHTSHEHQRFIAFYTAYMLYADDVGQHSGNIEAIGQFVQRFTQRAPQLDPVFNRLTALLGTTYSFYPKISGDGIISNTLESLTGMYIELTTQGRVIATAAARYPYYLRLKTGVGSAYAHFNFTRDWVASAGSFYLQTLPDLELIIAGINDILSFYKETMAGEKDNYVHMRAGVEGKPLIEVLRQLADEVFDSVRRLEELGATQPETGLDHIIDAFLMGYIEFHFNARRYRMEELDA